MPKDDLWFDEFYTRLDAPPPLVVVISGPSGVGKDAVLRRMQEFQVPFHFVVTAASRAPDPGEVDGEDYYFVTAARFEEMIQEEELLEYAEVYGEYKGIPREQVEWALASGKDVILRLDVQGAATIRQLVEGSVQIFLSAPCEAELEERLRLRKTEDPEKLARRLVTARAELRRVVEFDYVVVNRDGCLDGTVRQVLSIIQAEKCRVHPRRVVFRSSTQAVGSTSEDGGNDE